MLPQTEELRIETSTCCNYHCLFCPRDSFTRKKEVMSNALFEKIVDQAKKEMPDLKFISITGYGEFFFDPGWRKKLICARRLFSKVHIITNLSLTDYTDLDILLKYATDIRISAYALDDDTYRLIHRPSTGIHYDEIQNKILYLITHKQRHVNIILNYIEIPANKHQTEDWIAFWRDKADLLEAWRPHNWIEGKAYRHLCTHREPSCYRPFSGPVQVLADGRVNLCCFDYNGELIIGDASRDSFNDIYNSDTMRYIREYHREKQADVIPQCRVCDQRNCLDCRAKELLFNSKFNVYDRLKAKAADFNRL